MTKTIYWDDKDKRFMVICMQGCRVTHHKVPREITDPAAYAAALGVEPVAQPRQSPLPCLA